MKLSAQEVLLIPGNFNEVSDLDGVLSLTIDEALTLALSKATDKKLPENWYVAILAKLNETEQPAFTMGLASSDVIVTPVQTEPIAPAVEAEPIVMKQNPSQFITEQDLRNAQQEAEELKKELEDVQLEDGVVSLGNFEEICANASSGALKIVDDWIMSGAVQVAKNRPKNDVSKVYRKKVTKSLSHPDVKKMVKTVRTAEIILTDKDKAAILAFSKQEKLKGSRLYSTGITLESDVGLGSGLIAKWVDDSIVTEFPASKYENAVIRFMKKNISEKHFATKKTVGLENTTKPVKNMTKTKTEDKPSTSPGVQPLAKPIVDEKQVKATLTSEDIKFAIQDMAEAIDIEIPSKNIQVTTELYSLLEDFNTTALKIMTEWAAANEDRLTIDVDKFLAIAKDEVRTVFNLLTSPGGRDLHDTLGVYVKQNSDIEDLTSELTNGLEEFATADGKGKIYEALIDAVTDAHEEMLNAESDERVKFDERQDMEEDAALENKSYEMDFDDKNMGQYNYNYNDKNDASLKTAQYADALAEEQNELLEAIRDWQPHLPNLNELIRKVKNAKVWADLKKIWDDLWHGKEQVEPEDRPLTHQYQEFLDLGGRLAKKMAELKTLDKKSSAKYNKRMNKQADDLWKQVNWLEREDLVELLEGAGFAVSEDESDDELREAVVEAVRGGDIELGASEKTAQEEAIDISQPKIVRLKIWTGPASVMEIGESIKALGKRVTFGTEHVYVDQEVERNSSPGAAAGNLLAELRKAYGKDFGLKPQEIKVVRAQEDVAQKAIQYKKSLEEFNKESEHDMTELRDLMAKVDSAGKAEVELLKKTTTEFKNLLTKLQNEWKNVSR